MNLFNHDGVFFDVESPDVKMESLAREDVISLNVEEAVKEMATGSIKLFDPNHVYSRVFRPGVKLKITWGIEVPANGRMQKMSRSLDQVMINSPGGGGSNGGQITYDISFMALGWRGEHRTMWYESGTKRDVVSATMARLGVITQEINFNGMSDAINASNKVGQYETDYQFLVRLSDEWGAAFRMGYGKAGAYASFVDYAAFAGNSFTAQQAAGQVAAYGDYSKALPSAVAASAGGAYILLEYGTINANVKSYTWKDESADAANGDGARMVMVDGKPQIFRTIVEDEKVVTYRLVPERIEEELKVRDWSSRINLMVDYLSVKDFEQVKRFFVADVATTAPQGSGIVVNAEMMGDPLLTCGLGAKVGRGFPDRIGAEGKAWWTRRVSHNISKSGYFSPVEVADAFAFSPTGQVVSVNGW